MKKLLFVLFAALAFVACEKDKEESAGNFQPPHMLNILPDSYNAQAGSVIKIKTPIPTYNNSYRINDRPYDTGVDKMPISFPSGNENEYYKLVQTSADTYEITINPFNKPYKLDVRFVNTDDEVLNFGFVTINYTPAE